MMTLTPLRAGRWLAVALALMLLAVGGLDAGRNTARAAEMAVTIKDFAFAPAALTVPVGTTVRWTNNDAAPHTATSDSGAWDSGALATGQSFSFTFTQTGSFAYHCGIHSRMTATITVTGVAPAPTTTASPVTAPPAGPGDRRFASDAFQALWARTDAAAAGRTYVWGPGPFTDGLQEDYQEAAGGKRLVQYFDKARMELTTPGGPVTAGLLAVELITGRQQNGDATFLQREPARVTVAGDPDNAFPTYADLAPLQAAEADQTGAAAQITKLYQPGGTVGRYDAGAADPLATTAAYDAGTRHNLPKAFADFRAAPAFGGIGAIGLAISEPVWANVKVAGTMRPVLLQAFERRVLTYTPGNPAGFRVEYGNIGRAYYQWRYAQATANASADPAGPTPTAVSAPSPTPTPAKKKKERYQYGP